MIHRHILQMLAYQVEISYGDNGRLCLLKYSDILIDVE